MRTTAGRELLTPEIGARWMGRRAALAAVGSAPAGRAAPRPVLRPLALWDLALWDLALWDLALWDLALWDLAGRVGIVEVMVRRCPTVATFTDRGDANTAVAAVVVSESRTPSRVLGRRVDVFPAMVAW